MVADPVRLGTGVVAPIVPTAAAISALRPVPGGDVSITGGFWGERLRINRERTIRHGHEQLNAAGNFENFRLAAGADGEYRALGMMFTGPFPFLDSDVYKWLEAVGWELGRGQDDGLAAMADEAIGLVAAAQRPDGYLNTFVQVVAGGRPYEDLAWGHELYTLGHLVQAAVAWQRSCGDGRLLAIAERAVEHVHDHLGPRAREGLDGHPEIEMALVELFRTTGDRRHLDLAAWMVERRGRGVVGPGRFGPVYWQDHLPVREAPSVAGHAVRQLYLDCGAVDVAVETGDQGLLEAVRRRWQDMVERHSYVTGGLGSRHRDEAFGDPFELPPDRAYTETCAAIASVMLGWRLLLATGEPAAAAVVERTLYNAVLPGLALDGTSFFYVNPLQRRTQRAPGSRQEGHRQAWYACACCPPNLMRMMSSLEAYIATTDEGGVQVHQYATGEIGADTGGGRVRAIVETGYPWNGEVSVRIVESGPAAWTLSLRVPDWARQATVELPGMDRTSAEPPFAAVTRSWSPGDQVRLHLDTPARVTDPDPRIDAVRGCVAIERGPLVYCLETADLPEGTELEEITVAHDVRPADVPRADIAADAVGLELPAVRTVDGVALDVHAVPYFTWANRQAEAMRVWIPADGDTDAYPARLAYASGTSDA